MASGPFDPDEIINNLKIDNAVRLAAIQVAEDLQTEFNLVINEFYDGHSPHIYSRTYSTYYASSGYHKSPSSLIRQVSQYHYSAKIDVGSEYMPGGAYAKNPMHGLPVTVDEIFERTWDQGIHGLTAGDVPEEPWRRGKYIHWTVPPTSAPPHGQMDSRFASKFTQGYINYLILSHLG